MATTKGTEAAAWKRLHGTGIPDALHIRIVEIAREWGLYYVEAAIALWRLYGVDDGGEDRVTRTISERPFRISPKTADLLSRHNGDEFETWRLAGVFRYDD